jgi:hypothetical protein
VAATTGAAALVTVEVADSSVFVTGAAAAVTFVVVDWTACVTGAVAAAAVEAVAATALVAVALLTGAPRRTCWASREAEARRHERCPRGRRRRR